MEDTRFTPEQVELRKEHPEWWWVGPIQEQEIKGIEHYGKLRNQAAQKMRLKSRAGAESDRWNILGVAGEWAVREVYNQRINLLVIQGYDDIESAKKADCGRFIEVKTCLGATPDKWDLTENEAKLRDEYVYVSVLGCFYPKWMVVKGWAWGHEIRARGDLKFNKKSEVEFIRFRWQFLRDPNDLFDVLREKDPEGAGLYY